MRTHPNTPVVFTDFEDEVPKFGLSFIGFRSGPLTFGSIHMENDIRSHFKRREIAWILISNDFNASFVSSLILRPITL
jgi:hypothetical protein